MSLPPTIANPDSLTIILQKRLGFMLRGDAELNLWAGTPLKVGEQVTLTAIDTPATTAGYTAGDVSTLKDILTKKKAGK